MSTLHGQLHCDVIDAATCTSTSSLGDLHGHDTGDISELTAVEGSDELALAGLLRRQRHAFRHLLSGRDSLAVKKGKNSCKSNQVRTKFYVRSPVRSPVLCYIFINHFSNNCGLTGQVF